MSVNDYLKNVVTSARAVAHAFAHPFRWYFHLVVGSLIAVVVSGAWLYFGLYLPPTFFPLRTLITVPEGADLSVAAHLLKEAQVVRSEGALAVIVTFKGGENQVRAGDYYFDHRLTVVEVAERLMKGEYGLEPFKITVPEGATTFEMAELFSSKLTRFDKDEFLRLAADKEGYLFPDTYYLLPNAATSQVLGLLEKNFYDRIATIEDKIASFGRPIHEVVVMASLLEKEAWDNEERKIIAGVLWHRIEIEMPLQVDAVFGYINATSTFSPKFSHLAVDSPYNTYKNRGLPPGPIGSPSLGAIEAAVTPVPTESLYYLHGRDGSLHVAQTFSEHIANRRRYLR